MQPDLSETVLKGMYSAFHNLGTGGRVVVFLLLGAFLLPWVLRILSFFRRGGGANV